MIRAVKLLIVASFFVFAITPAFAIPITYTYSATGIGTLGGTSFAGASFIITSIGDTNYAYYEDAYGSYYNPSISATINIAGIGLATFTEATGNFVNNDISAVGLAEGSYDLLDLKNAAFGTWDIVSSIGPIFDPNPYAIWQFKDVSTDQGLLTFTNIRDVTFIARVGDLVSSRAVSEPSTLLLLGAGVAGVGIMRRRLRR